MMLRLLGIDGFLPTAKFVKVALFGDTATLATIFLGFEQLTRTAVGAGVILLLAVTVAL